MADNKLQLDEGFEEVPLDEGFQEIPLNTSSPTTKSEVPQEEPSTLSDFVSAFGQGATLGISDEILGALEAAADVATTDKKLEDLYNLYRQHQKEEEQKYKEARERSPTATLTGELMGGFAVPGLGSAGAIGKGASIASKIARGAAAGGAIGAATGLGKSEATIEQPEELAKETLVSGGLGAGLGGIMSGTAALAGKIVEKAAPKVEEVLEKYPTGRLIKKAYSTTKEGKGFASDESGNRIMDLGKQAQKEFGEAFYGPESPIAKTSKEIGSLFEEAGKKGGRVEADSGLISKVEELFPDVNSSSFKDATFGNDIRKLLNGEMSPQEAYNLGIRLQEKGVVGKAKMMSDTIAERETGELADMVKSAAKKATDEALGEERTRAAFDKFKQARQSTSETIFNKGKPLEISNVFSGDYGTVGGKVKLDKELDTILTHIADPATTGDKARETIRVLEQRLNQLGEQYPDLKLDTKGMISKLKDVAMEKTIRSKILSNQGSGTVGSILGRLGEVSGYGGAATAGWLSKFPKWSNDQLVKGAQKLKLSKVPHLGAFLEDAIINNKGPAAKNAAIFSIMQNPEARKALEGSEEIEE